MMSRSTCFVQPCPTCGRSLQIRVEYLGREVVCEHCHGKLRAADPQAPQLPHGGTADLLRRADELLESTRLPTQP
jgi:hypothetical protein